MITDDTIAAFASPVVPGGRIVLRVSGPRVFEMAGGMMRDQIARAATARHVMFDVRGYCFPAWVYGFISPHSYTGEDSIEFHLPGNPLLANELLAELLDRGIRPAEPGEFTARAFLRGKLDLAEAEGVAAVISAADSASAHSARRLLNGELATRLAPAMDRLARTLALIEAEIDFSEEDVSFLPVDALRTAITQTRAELQMLLSNAAKFRPLSHEPTIALVGRPNAGKSTLVNALAGLARSVVSSDAGTTRDVLSAPVKLPGGVVMLLDLAGLETTTVAGSAPEQEIAYQMQSRALIALSTADRMVYVQAADDTAPPLQLPVQPDLHIITKSDLVPGHQWPSNDIALSAHTGTGLTRLLHELNHLVFQQSTNDTSLLNERHENHIRRALDGLDRTGEFVDQGQTEIIADELRHALDELGAVLGSITPDDILGKIFATFCIGK